MNKDLSKKEFTNSLLRAILITLFLIAALSAGFMLDMYNSNERLLVSSLEAGGGIKVSYSSAADIGRDVLPVSLSQNPPYVEPEKKDNLTKIYSIVAVSTGEIEEVNLKDSVGNFLGKATVLKVMSVDEGGKPKKLGVALQIFPGDETENITPWFIKFPANFRGIVINGDPSTGVSKEEIKKVFQRGTWWSFIPLYDLSSPFISEEMKEDYIPLARRYYQNDTANLLDFITSGLTKSYKRTILLLGINTYP